MKKLFLVILVLGIFVTLAACIKPTDIMNYLTSQEYSIIDMVDCNYYILTKDGKIFYTLRYSGGFRKNIPRNVEIVEMVSLQPRGSFSINIK